AGAGRIGNYEGCAFAVEGQGWFTAQPGAHPAVGEVAQPERVSEVRWETVVPRQRVAAAIRAYIAAHPYEEPAFDLYPVEDVRPGAGLGRVGRLPAPMSLGNFAGHVARTFGGLIVRYSGSPETVVERVAIMPGSGRQFVEASAALADVLVTGDLGYHEAERAAELGISLVVVSHGDLEWWALKRWAEKLRQELREGGVEVIVSQAWTSPWADVPATAGAAAQSSGTSLQPQPLFEPSDEMAASPQQVLLPERAGKSLRLRVDGGSRGNPGEAAIGVVLEDEAGRVVDQLSRRIGVTTNNVAEYKALLAGLELAAHHGATKLQVLTDSQLLARQLTGSYRVRNKNLQELHRRAQQLLESFAAVDVVHVLREENTAADDLVNAALDGVANGQVNQATEPTA
ncbi:MAG: Nif3-like dinuclear metal center hexameric protein, partial [Thermoleophilia bacterium]|nr:Nif3-like dinuclear metal center hexameric protein [Thermoleophilia bacterium]